MSRHKFCTQHNQSYPPESSCPKCRQAASLPQVRRIITIARTMQSRWGWDRRRCIRFALETVKRNPKPPRKYTRHAMSGETQEYLTHRQRSTSR